MMRLQKTYITQEMRTELDTHTKHYLHWEESEDVCVHILCRYVDEKRGKCSILNNISLSNLFIVAYTSLLVSVVGIILATLFLSLYTRLLCIGILILLAYVLITKFFVALKQHERYWVSFSNSEKNIMDVNCISAIMKVETILSIWKPWESIKSVLRLVKLSKTNCTKQSSELLRLANEIINNINSIPSNHKMELLGCYVIENNQYFKIIN